MGKDLKRCVTLKKGHPKKTWSNGKIEHILKTVAHSKKLLTLG